MKSKNQIVVNIFKNLKSETKETQDLNKLFLKQQDQMLKNNPKQLIETLNEIEKKVNILQRKTDERHYQLQQLGLTPNSKGILELINKMPEKTKIQIETIWKGYKETIQDCKKLNEEIGQLLTIQRDIIEQGIGKKQEYDYGQLRMSKKR